MECTTDNTFSAKGFTLVELMIVVAIVVVLASVAVVGYVRHIKSGRLVGARAFVARIQAQQAAFHEQNGLYCNASGAVGPTTTANFYPPLVSGSEPLAKRWAPPVGSAWHQLRARPEKDTTHAAVFVRASLPDANPAADHQLDNLAPLMGVSAQPTAMLDAGVDPMKHPWFYVVAHLDLDNSGGYSNGGCASSGSAVISTPNCTVLWASSGRPSIVVTNEGR